MLAGLYITPKGFTTARNFSSMNRAPMLSAKQDPTKSMSSQGFILNVDFGIATSVLNFIIACLSFCKK
jgi:hypothetical protein